MGNTSDIVGLLFALLFQIFIGTICLLGFSILRPLNKQVYECKIRNSTVLSSRFWAWVKPLWVVNESNEIEELGLDGIMLLRFISLGCKFFAALSVFSIPLIIVHIYAPDLVRGVRPQFLTFEGILIQNPSLVILSMANIPQWTPIFYLHTALAYMYSFYCMYLLTTTWKEYVSLRKRYFSSDEYRQDLHNRTLLFTYVPTKLQTVQNFRDYLLSFSKSESTRVLPKQILFGRNYLELPDLIREHERLIRKLERIIYDYLKNPRKNYRIYHYEGIPLFSRPIDTIDFYKKKLHNLEHRIYHARSRADESFLTDSSCFVEYEDTLAAHVVARQSKGITGTFWKHPPKCSVCPPFADIIWKSIGLDRIEKLQRKGICFILLCLLFLIWLIFQSCVTTLSSIETWRVLGENVASYIEKRRLLVILVQSFLTPSLMALLNYLLPFALRAIARLQGLLTFTSVEKSTLFKYFLFQVLLVLVHITFSFVPSMVISLVNGEKTSTTFTMFITNLLDNFVSLSTTYINYMITGFTYFGLELIQGASLILAVYRTFLQKTPREQQELDAAPGVQFVTIYGFLLFIFLLGVSYSLVAPLIIPFTALSFFLAYAVMKYQLLYVYDTKIESGGTWWPKIFSYLCFALGLFQLCTLGAILCVGSQSTSIAMIHDDSVFVVFLIVLPILTVFFYYYTIAEYQQKGNFIDGSEYQFIAKSPSLPESPTRPTLSLMQRVFNPASFGPLAKIWLQPHMQEFVPALYYPMFEDELDYMRTVHPALLEKLEKEHEARKEERKLSKILKKRTLAAFVFSSSIRKSDQTDEESRTLL